MKLRWNRHAKYQGYRGNSQRSEAADGRNRTLRQDARDVSAASFMASPQQSHAETFSQASDDTSLQETARRAARSFASALSRAMRSVRKVGLREVGSDSLGRIARHTENGLARAPATPPLYDLPTHRYEGSGGDCEKPVNDKGRCHQSCPT